MTETTFRLPVACRAAEYAPSKLCVLPARTASVSEQVVPVEQAARTVWIVLSITSMLSPVPVTDVVLVTVSVTGAGRRSASPATG